MPNIKHDGKFVLATAPSSNRKKWTNAKWLWSDFVEKLGTPTVTQETYAEYLRMTKAEQGRVKDVGGYIGAHLKDGLRRNANVIDKQILTLDVDNGTIHFWEDFTMSYDIAACLHTTHKHSSATPRYRLLIPLSRAVTTDEYQAVARKIADNLNIELFDPTTFEIARLMYWGSHAADGEWIFEVQDGEWLDPDEVLSEYVDWRDVSEWAFHKGSKAVRPSGGRKAKDPEEKTGLVGAFCRTYDVYGAIETFLSDVYEPTTDPTRFTYIGGTTEGGMIIYEDGAFSFSHHATDPSSGQLCNSFDLVRIHKFGMLDEGYENEGSNRSPSFKAMIEFVKEDGEVVKTISQERLLEAQNDFSVIEDEEQEDLSEEDLEWTKDLKVNSRNEFESCSFNIRLILKNDPNMKGLLGKNMFDRKDYILKSPSWRDITKPEPLNGVDYSGIRSYIETRYDITSISKVDDAIALESVANEFHPVREYLESLKWDGKNRLENLLIDYFGAEDNEYTRAAIKKTLVGAVARVFDPGCKFDLVLTLVGEQGTKKSSFFSFLGKDWFSDTFSTAEGKTSFEQLQGTWIIEIAELAGLRKMDIETIKHYITKRTDTYRPAYGRTVENYPRQCVFVATTNNRTFLRDATGNRRFMPIDVRTEFVKKDVFSPEFKSSIDQIWAEAYQLYLDGEPLHLSGIAHQLAEEARGNHSELDERTGVVADFLDIKLPTNWEEMPIDLRRGYLVSESDIEQNGVVERQHVCIAEIWCECFGRDKSDLTPQNSRAISDMLSNLKNWEQKQKVKTFALYGRQRYFKRIKDE